MSDGISGTLEDKVFSFGCRLNIAEGDHIATLLRRERAAGKTSSGKTSLSKTLVVNTCAVTHEAERQVRQKIRRLHREHPQARIVVAGCAAHLNANVYSKMAGVAKVLGNDAKLLAKSYRNDAKTTLPSPERERRTPMLPPDTEGEATNGEATFSRTRFVLPVQQGCNHRCTFCMIPLARGGARSLSVELACESVSRAVARGVKEVVLSGIDLASWGEDLEQNPRPLLGSLVEAVLRKNPRLERLRLSSIDGAALDPLLQKLFGEEERLMPYLHLSLQSGDNMILKRMRRRHSREQAITLCQNLRARRPDLALGADLIAGFPTESEAMFQNTLSLIDEAGLRLLHIFPFSKRQGTPAARMPQVERSLVLERARRLRAKAEAAHRAFLHELYGKTDRFLVEGGLVEGEDEGIIGRSRHNMRTRLLPPCDNSSGNSSFCKSSRVSSGAGLKGCLVRARILSAAEQRCSRSLTARMLPEEIQRREAPCLA